MKKLIFGLILSLCAVSVFSATLYVEEGSNGDIRIAEEGVTWKRNSTTVQPDVLQYGEAWKKAYQQPGKPVQLREPVEEVELEGLWTAEVRTVAPLNLIRPEGSHVVRVEENRVLTKKSVWSFFYLAWFATLLLMAVHAWFLKKGGLSARWADKPIFNSVAGVLLIVGTFHTSVSHGWMSPAMMLVSFGLIMLTVITHATRRRTIFTFICLYFVSALAHLVVTML